MKYADVIIDISHGKLDRTYQYRIPEMLSSKIMVGSSVVVPFGNGSRRISGYVVSLSDTPSIDESRIKDICLINDRNIRIEDDLIALACFIREYFGGTLNDALKTVMPVKKAVKQKVNRDVCAIASEEELSNELSQAVRKKHKAKERLLRELIAEKRINYDMIIDKLMVSRQTISSLEEHGLVRIEEHTAYRNPTLKAEAGKSAVELNETQRAVANEIIGDIKNGVRKDYLIHGITGSGKTEVYMEVIEEVIRRGKQVIMLIPEIALTYQTVMRFIRRFGDRVSILNSRMSAGERYDQSVRAKNGEIDIMIGPRSSLFTPFAKLGLIIIDEEHEESYKNEGVPHYDARVVAMHRGKMSEAPVIFGSATPSLDTYSRAKSGEIKLFEMNERAGRGNLPEVHVIDMREELKAKNRSIFSRTLRELIEDRLRKGEQTMLFLNRRGYSGFVSCRSCGNIIKCPHCDVSLTKHRNDLMVCHYCGYTEKLAAKCPSCGSPYIGSFGIGTEKIEEQIKETFKGARVLRMDADTTKGKNGHEEILSAFKNGEADILVGTQMIVKGHDFHNVTLVGILAADMSLGVSDYRSAERTFDLLTQSAGRAGRGEKKGEVVIQTYQPEHYSIVASAACDYGSFYNEEIAFRRLMGYPPAANLLLVLCTTTKEEAASPHAAFVAERLRKIIEELQYEKDVKLIGYSPAGISKLNDIFRQTIYIKAKDYDKLVKIKNRLAEDMTTAGSFAGAQVIFDFNPTRTI